MLCCAVECCIALFYAAMPAALQAVICEELLGRTAPCCAVYTFACCAAPRCLMLAWLLLLLLLQAVIYEELLQINPGSATGAYSTFTDSVQPSFVLMDLDGSKVSMLVVMVC
jgi:hypothetical protein